MIVLSNAIEPKASKATSTYPAVVTNTDGKTWMDSAFTRLVFFCPSTMNGEPKDYTTGIAGNTLLAPTKPHDTLDGNDEMIAYNFQIGDIIIISYSDGNLNSPQFVRYVPITDEIREINASYVGGSNVVQDGILSIADESLTLNTDILQKSAKLLSYIRLAATGKDSSTEETEIYDRGLFSTLIYYRCGRYGTEFLKFAPEVSLDNNNPVDDIYNTSAVCPTNTFMNIAKVLYNSSIIPNTEIVNIYKDVIKNL